MSLKFDGITKRARALAVLGSFVIGNVAMSGQTLAEGHTLAFGAFGGGDTARSQAQVTPRKGLFTLDYQDIRLPGGESIDLLGYHILTPVNDWLYFGIGSYAPVLKGAYGGFMGFGIKAHAQRNVTNHIFVNGGFAFGGGGGGKSIKQSIALSGTGGYLQSYIGLGYAFEKFSAGVNISHMKFFKSDIDGTQINVFFQRPFHYSTSPYAKHRARATPVNSPSSGARADGNFGSMITLGLDHYAQINPTGSFKGEIGAADLQYSKFITKQRYWYYALGVGYKGLPTYNQAIGGIGYRFSIGSRINLYAQLGIGSGGFAPTLIDTGSGLLLYPKLTAEYKIGKDLGLALTAGYSHAIDGTARNYTYGLALLSHFRIAHPAKTDLNAIEGRYKGFRFSITHETAFDISYKALSGARLNMIVIQGQKALNDTIFLPLRAAISYQSYRGYPGYGEVAAGIGISSKYRGGNRFQLFGAVQVGANVQGPIARASVGFDYGFNDNLALRGEVGKTIGSTGFQSTNIGIGITQRFSLLSY